MNDYETRELKVAEFPPLLAEIPQPPKRLWATGTLPPKHLVLLSVVGSRKYTSYGRQVIEHLFKGLSGYPVGIVSGLALGIDALAHETALTNNIYTIAVPGSGLDEKVLYPATNRRLARKILEAGGGLLSELPPETPAAKWTFPKRNRIMAGMCEATLLIEAGEKSGTLITARMATDYNRELLVVPANIFSSNAKGVHQFLKLGATPVTDAEDILLALGIEVKDKGESSPRPSLSAIEEAVINLLHEPQERDLLIRLLGIPPAEANILLMQMEMREYIKSDGTKYFSLL
ncbi:MAG: DNA-processing protein DprA [Candidatus Paceibacteria bacterium]